MMNNSIFLGFIFILLSLSTKAQQDTQTLLKAYDEKMEQSNYKAAEAICDQLVLMQPKIVYHRLLRAHVKDQRSNRRGAINEILTAITIYPENDTLYNTIGVYYQQSGYFDSSEYHFRQALTYSSSKQMRIDVVNNLGTTYYFQKKYREAINMYERFLKQYPRNTAMLVNLASGYDEIDEKQKGIGLLKKAIVIDPRMYQAYNNIGLLYSDIAEYDSAIAYLSQGLGITKVEQNKAYSYSNIGFCYHKLKNYKRAMEHYDKSIKLGPTNPWVYKNKALTYIELDMNKEACEYLSESKRRGYERFYGPEVNELIEKHCGE